MNTRMCIIALGHTPKRVHKRYKCGEGRLCGEDRLCAKGESCRQDQCARREMDVRTGDTHARNMDVQRNMDVHWTCTCTKDVRARSIEVHKRQTQGGER